jgi:steroid 5-alpha reductase family enzyme
MGGRAFFVLSPFVTAPELEILAADLVATFVVFLGSAAKRNSSVYDAYWSVAPAVVAVGLLWP